MGKEITRGELVRDYEEPMPLVTRTDAEEAVHVVVRDALQRTLAFSPLGTLLYKLDDARFEQYWPNDPDPKAKFFLSDVLRCEPVAVAEHTTVVLFALSVRRGMLEMFDDGMEVGYREPLGGYPVLLRQMKFPNTRDGSVSRVHPAAALFAQRFLKRMPRSREDVAQYKAILEANAHGLTQQ